MSNLQSSDTTQNTTLSSHTTQKNTNITILQNKTVRITSANGASTNISNQIYLTTSTGEGLKNIILRRVYFIIYN